MPRLANIFKPIKSALKKGAKETIKTYKYDLMFSINKFRVRYKREKNEVRKKVYSLQLSEQRTQVCTARGEIRGGFPGRGGRKSKRASIRTVADFSDSAFAFKRD